MTLHREASKGEFENTAADRFDAVKRQITQMLALRGELRGDSMSDGRWRRLRVQVPERP